MKILIASSGAGGHIFPAISAAQELKQHNLQIYFVTDKRCPEDLIIEKGFSLERLSVIRLDFSSFFSFLKSLIKLIQSFFESSAILRKIKPSVVIGFGGYATLPIVFIAGLLAIPIVIHEQNVIPGRANRLCDIFAKKIAVSFKETEKYFDSRKTFFSGCPVRACLKKVEKEIAFKELNLNPEKFTILVIGGSAGSRKINEVFLEAISKFKGLSQLQVIHISGERDYDFVKNAYRNIAVEACCIAFLKKMGYAYSITDLAISRAGGSSLAELAFFGIPSILIPYPFAYNHQKANAAVFENHKASIVIEEKELSAERLNTEIFSLLSEKQALITMKKNAEKLASFDAPERLAEVVLSLAEKNA